MLSREHAKEYIQNGENTNVWGVMCPPGPSEQIELQWREVVNTKSSYISNFMIATKQQNALPRREPSLLNSRDIDL